MILIVNNKKVTFSNQGRASFIIHNPTIILNLNPFGFVKRGVRTPSSGQITDKR